MGADSGEDGLVGAFGELAVVVGLEIEPGIGGPCEVAGEADGGIGGECAEAPQAGDGLRQRGVDLMAARGLFSGRCRGGFRFR